MNTSFTRGALSLPALMVFTLLLLTPIKARSSEPAVSPEATVLLEQMTQYLSSLEQFHVKTENTLEDLLDSGNRVDLDVSANVLIKRPHMLKSERKGEVVDQSFYYDGKELTLYNHSNNVYATKSVPNTFEELFQYMYDSLGFAVPVSDLLYKDAYPLLMKDVTMAKVIRTTTLQGISCTHLLFSQPGVDFQVWVAEGNKPLPLKYVVTDTSIPARMSVSTTLSDWNLNPAADDSQFTFTPPADAQKVDFLPL